MIGEERVEILEPYELKYSDLKLFSSSDHYHLSSKSPISSPPEELIRCLLENLGPTGPGLITVTGVPNCRRLRRMLLPLARRLALLNSDHRRTVFKEHSLGSDVSLKKPDRDVSSFAMQLKYLQYNESNTNQALQKEDEEEIGEQNDLKNLGKNFRELEICMMELGLCLARICDRALNGLDLEKSLLESCTAKGRLIHYHSSFDNHILNDGVKRPQSTNIQATKPSTKNETTHGNEANLWQQWHYDYGIFTILTSPMFTLPCNKQVARTDKDSCSSCVRECPSPSGHTFLKIFNKNKSRVQLVKADPESFIVQVGEAADILSKGRLRANLHSVDRSEKIKELSRETFVVFLQPRWDKTLSISDYLIESSQSDVQQDCELGGTSKGEHRNRILGQELHNIVPPLSSRLKDGMTFAEFSQITTNQYYGGRGLQTKR